MYLRKGVTQLSMSYADTLNLDAGEEIHILSTVKPTCESEEPFVIREAAWQLLDQSGGLWWKETAKSGTMSWMRL